MRRRFLSLLALLSMALSLALSACSDPGADSSPPPSEVPLSDGEVYMAKLAEQGWESSPFAPHTSFLPDPDPSQEYFQAEGVDLSQWDLTSSLLDRLVYDSNTIFPDSLPEGYDPAADLELGMDPGLGVRALHERGITGEGVNIGIVDQALPPHQEYDGKIRYYYNSHPEGGPSMHGPAVTSLAVGEQVGTAPGARVYYACYDRPLDAEPGSRAYYEAAHIASIHHLLDLNETLPPEDKMSVISVSHSFPADLDLYQEAVARAEEQGVWLLTVNELQEQGFCGMIRAPLADPNDLESYEKSVGYAYLGIPTGRRSYASSRGETYFEQHVQGGISWCEPYLAGVYALARQVDPELTPDDFVALAHETGYRSYHPTATRLNPDVFDPVALIEALEARS